MAESPPGKFCALCKRERPAGEFVRQGTSSDGLGAYCRECRRHYQRVHREEKREQELQRVMFPAPTAPKSAAYDLKGFVRFCGCLTLDNNERYKLLPFEREIARPYFGGAVETVVVIGKKNGKTTELAALALYHVKSVKEAECVIGASSRDQATILFNQASGLIKRSGRQVGKSRWEIDGAVFEIRSGYREIRCNGGRIRVLAADAATADGVIPTLALVDELHRHPSGELYGVFRDGLTPRSGRMLTISTAGANLESPLGQLRERAHDLPTFKRAGMKNTARSQDGSFVWLEWCLSDTDDVHNMRVVKRANPAPWHTIEALRRRHDSPTMIPSQWARFACGVWTAGEDPAIQPADWDRLRVDIGRVQEGEEVVCYVSGTKDQAAILLAAQRPDEAVAVRAEVIDNAPFEVIEHRLCELFEGEDARYRAIVIGYDPAWFERSAQFLTNRGLPMEDDPSVPMRLTVASGTLLRLIQSQKLMHDGDAVLREQVLRGASKDTERGWRFLPTAKNRALIALAMATHRASLDLETEPLLEVM